MSEIDINAGESDWTKENLQKLFTALKSAIPKCKTESVYTKGLKRVDWNKVAFPPFSPEACQKKWTEILSKMRKIRTLTEIIDEAEEKLSSTVSVHMMHPEFQKKPAPASAIFYKENWAKFQKRHPELSYGKLLKFVANKYRELPDEEKAQYVEKSKHASKEYTRQKVILKPPKRKRKVSADAPDEDEQRTKDAKSLPPKPPFNGYQLFCKEQLLSMAGVSNSRYVSVWAQRWRDLTESQRNEYSARCIELKRKYANELNEYLMTLDEEEQQRILNDNGIKRPKVQKHPKEVKLLTTLPGEPKMPPRSSNVLFCKNQMEVLKEEFPNANERFIKANQMWRGLSIKEKQFYKQQLVEQFKKYSLELQKWFKMLTAAEQADYLRKNPSKFQFLDAQKTKKNKREESFLSQPSDSEDEVIEISSSEEEEDSLGSSEEEEEEEEEGDIAFDLY